MSSLWSGKKFGRVQGQLERALKNDDLENGQIPELKQKIRFENGISILHPDVMYISDPVNVCFYSGNNDK